METEEEELEVTRDHVVRKSTKLEVGLAMGLAMNLVAVVWFAATMASKVDNVSNDLKEAVVEIRAFRGSAAELSVLKYRIEQLEKPRR